MVKNIVRKHIFNICFFLSFSTFAQNAVFDNLCKEFVKEYGRLGLAEIGLDYKTNFSLIKNNEQLAKEEAFFKTYLEKLKPIIKEKLNLHELIRLSQLNYECNLNLERIALQKKWNDAGRKIPLGGLHSMENYKEWYSYIVKYFTSVNITPEKVFEYGQSEVDKIKKEIVLVRDQLGFKNDEAFYNHLKRDTFYITDKNTILKKYAVIDSTVRKNYKTLFPEYQIPVIGVMEWPDAGPNTPPGIYLNNSNNPFGKDVFQFNFYGSKHNSRSMEWLYMHEAIPGHHFQYTAKHALKSDPLTNHIFIMVMQKAGLAILKIMVKKWGFTKTPIPI